MFEIYKMVYMNKNNKAKLRILNKIFVKNNVNKSKLVINNKKKYIKEFIPTNDIISNVLKIKMIISRDISNGNYMFKDCESLLFLSFYNNFEDVEIINEYEVLDKNQIIFENSGTTIYNNHSFYQDVEKYNIESEISKKEENNSSLTTILNMNDNLTYFHNKFISIREIF